MSVKRIEYHYCCICGGKFDPPTISEPGAEVAHFQCLYDKIPNQEERKDVSTTNADSTKPS